MKILIICSGWGSWIKPYIKTFSSDTKFDIYALNVGSKDLEGLDHKKSYSIELSERELHGNISNTTYQKYKKIIEKVNPDIIHVYGTENNMGLLIEYVHDIPIIINIQGLLSDIQFFTGSYLHYSEIKKYRSLKNYFGYGGFVTDKQIKNNCKAEKEILLRNQYFVGRTNMDRSVVYFMNAKATYYIGEELLRPSFYQSEVWNVSDVERHSIFMPSGFNPIKGMHLAMEAVHLLLRDYPDIKLYIPGVNKDYFYANKLWRYLRGEMYTNYLRDLLERYNMKDHVVLTGWLTADGMIKRMQQSHVFLSPTVTDNSPNCVGEATMLGMPIVASYVGGIPSFLKDEESCLFANSGDPYLMASAIKRIFDNDDLAIRLGRMAFLVAKKRHSPDIIKKQYAAIYENVINDFNNKRK